MSRELLEKAQAVVGGARRRGAEGVRVSISRNRNSRVDWRDGKLDRLRESTSMQLGLTLFVNGRYSSHGTSDLRPEALERFLDETIAMTRLLAPDPHRRLPDPARYAGRHIGDLQCFDAQGSAGIRGIDRRRTAEALEGAARSPAGAERIVSVSTICSDTLGESVLVNSNGMEGAARNTTFFMMARTTVRDEGDRKPEGLSYAVSRFRMQPDKADQLGQDSTRRAIQHIGARSASSGQYRCVIESRVAARLLGDLLSPLYGQAVQQQQSFLAQRRGEQITSPVLSIIDDPHVVQGLGSAAYDSEGMSTQRMPLFERGVLRNFYLDTYYASKLGHEATTGSQTNLVFADGTRDLDGLLRAMGSGILITDFVGGNSNSTTGDFSTGVNGHWIENGQRVRPITEMNLSGNHLEFWKQLAELGNDPDLNSEVRVPSLRFDEVQFSGS